MTLKHLERLALAAGKASVAFAFLCEQRIGQPLDPFNDEPAPSPHKLYQARQALIDAAVEYYRKGKK